MLGEIPSHLNKTVDLFLLPRIVILYLIFNFYVERLSNSILEFVTEVLHIPGFSAQFND